MDAERDLASARADERRAHRVDRVLADARLGRQHERVGKRLGFAPCGAADDAEKLGAARDRLRGDPLRPAEGRRGAGRREPGFGGEPSGDDLELVRKAHWAIEKVTGDMSGRFAFNTAIAAVMELMNELTPEKRGAASAGVPSAGTLSAGTPSTGTPSAGPPSTGTPCADAPAAPHARRPRLPKG
mgnify:CR=1 FL=1